MFLSKLYLFILKLSIAQTIIATNNGLTRDRSHHVKLNDISYFDFSPCDQFNNTKSPDIYKAIEKGFLPTVTEVNLNAFSKSSKKICSRSSLILEGRKIETAASRENQIFSKVVNDVENQFKQDQENQRTLGELISCVANSTAFREKCISKFGIENLREFKKVYKGEIYPDLIHRQRIIRLAMIKEKMDWKDLNEGKVEKIKSDIRDSGIEFDRAWLSKFFRNSRQLEVSPMEKPTEQEIQEVFEIVNGSEVRGLNKGEVLMLKESDPELIREYILSTTPILANISSFPASHAEIEKVATHFSENFNHARSMVGVDHFLYNSSYAIEAIKRLPKNEQADACHMANFYKLKRESLDKDILAGSTILFGALSVSRVAATLSTQLTRAEVWSVLTDVGHYATIPMSTRSFIEFNKAQKKDAICMATFMEKNSNPALTNSCSQQDIQRALKTVQLTGSATLVGGFWGSGKFLTNFVKSKIKK